MPDVTVEQVPALSDNYVHLLRCPDSGACAAVDPGEARPVLAALQRLGWRLTHILCTHHHADHIGGTRDLVEATNAQVVGARADSGRIPGLDLQVGEGDMVTVGGLTAEVLEVPGHTSGHLAYHFAAAGVVFTGDTLFSLGCGRLFEGTPEQMWRSLCRLRALPESTRIYCGHEYTNSNADFALTVEPDNAALKRRAGQVLALREAGRSSLPSTVGEEKAANPFLRADVADLLRAAGLEGLGPVEAFAAIRRRKDGF